MHKGHTHFFSVECVPVERLVLKMSLIGFFIFILFFKKLGVFYHPIFRLLIQNSGVVTEIRPKRNSPDKERLFGFKDWQESFFCCKSHCRLIGSFKNLGVCPISERSTSRKKGNHPHCPYTRAYVVSGTELG